MFKCMDYKDVYGSIYVTIHYLEKWKMTNKLLHETSD